MIKGKLVELTFLDHCIQGKGEKLKGTMKFKIWGRVERMSKEVIVIRQWELQTGSKDMKKNNNEIATILRSAIIDIKFLVPLPEPVTEGN